MPILAAWKYLTREMRRSDGCVLRKHIGDAKLCVLNRHNFESIWKTTIQSFLYRSSCAKLLAQIARAEALDIAAPVYVMLLPCLHRRRVADAAYVAIAPEFELSAHGERGGTTLMMRREA